MKNTNKGISALVVLLITATVLAVCVGIAYYNKKKARNEKLVADALSQALEQTGEARPGFSILESNQSAEVSFLYPAGWKIHLVVINKYGIIGSYTLIPNEASDSDTVYLALNANCGDYLDPSLGYNNVYIFNSESNPIKGMMLTSRQIQNKEYINSVLESPDSDFYYKTHQCRALYTKSQNQAVLKGLALIASSLKSNAR